MLAFVALCLCQQGRRRTGALLPALGGRTMIRTCRLAMLAPLVLSSLALGPAASAHPVAGQAPALASAKAKCLLTQDTANSKPDAPKFILAGAGFKAHSVSFAGGNGGGVTTTTNGSFSVNDLNAGRYTAKSDKDGTVNCGRTPQATGGQKNAKAQYRQGFSDGFAAIKKDCEAKPPQSLATVNPNYVKGFDDGAALATKQFCE
ncbi:hypothetical protein ACIGXM_00300 [Kitasatospora sp. NPDC052896]|uniref:hypothetical protein n=1 Tax=Kitasatospora sp. NPDC052896 TaxID=3364061 RepID=UPI0037CA5683